MTDANNKEWNEGSDLTLIERSIVNLSFYRDYTVLRKYLANEVHVRLVYSVPDFMYSMCQLEYITSQSPEREESDHENP